MPKRGEEPKQQRPSEKYPLLAKILLFKCRQNGEDACPEISAASTKNEESGKEVTSAELKLWRGYIVVKTDRRSKVYLAWFYWWVNKCTSRVGFFTLASSGPDRSGQLKL